MNVAVLTLTRDRLAYTQHCFARLRELAGCPFDHYVFDNGSTDGTREWLQAEYANGNLHALCLSRDNIGIHRAMNELLGNLDEGYDVVVKVDNDCELTVPGTLLAVCECARLDASAMIGPVVNGLRSPMPIVSEKLVIVNETWVGGGDIRSYRVGVTPMIGGIMQPVPNGHRYDETQPLWGMDDTALSAQAKWCGQLLDYPVNHYRTTDGQHEDYPGYFERRVAAGGPD